ncbi:MAG: hypothetical protein ACRDQ2_16205 [Gaiellales bacterium]
MTDIPDDAIDFSATSPAPDENPLTPADRVQASAVRFLIDGSEEDAASVLLACELDYWTSGDTWHVGDELIEALHIRLVGPRSATEQLAKGSGPIHDQVYRATEAVVPVGYYIKHWSVSAKLVDIDPDWREELLEIARGRGISNQGAAIARELYEWKNLKFRSKSEIKIAEALDRANVLFLPNCAARLGLNESDRRKREADFLICEGGKWGILEVDGEPFHPPSRTVQDHERDRYFKQHGIRTVEHYDATRCYNEPDAVVAEFLGILRQS